MVKRRSVTGVRKKHKASKGAAAGQTHKTGSIPAQGRRANASTNPGSSVMSSGVSTLSSTPGRVGTKRKSSDFIEGVDDPNDIQPPKRFAILLKPRFRYINQDVIKTKWEVLPENMQHRVRELFMAVERPILARQPGENMTIEAQAALSTVTKTLAKRLPRMPFPTKTKEEHFNYEALTSKNLTLEHQLTLILHSTALLQSQITKEKRLLAKEQAALNELKRNAKAEVNIRRRQTSKRPEVLRQLIRVEDFEDNAVSIGLVKLESIKLSSLEMNIDASLQPLLLQLRSHLESMENNATQMKGMKIALLQTAAVLESQIATS
ncbi:hypothetical protein MMC11_001027 [Xylographa trunciseda]|nr:hypothetical protein [Xylographa trunciseda]